MVVKRDGGATVGAVAPAVDGMLGDKISRFVCFEILCFPLWTCTAYLRSTATPNDMLRSSERWLRPAAVQEAVDHTKREGGRPNTLALYWRYHPRTGESQS